MADIFNIPFKQKKKILALGAESAGNFSFCANGKIYLSDNFGDLLEENNFLFFKKSVSQYLKKNGIKPDVITCDAHPLFKTTIWARELAKKNGAEFFQVQHHIAHIFSAYGEANFLGKDDFFGIAMDGTGYGMDGKIWGGEVFKISNLCVERIGHLENQIMIGNELAIKEPARVLISILEKFLDKKEVYKYVAQYYSRQEFEVLFNQLKQNFNCAETSSAGRVLDAVSVLLGFSSNERKYKHQPIDLLEKKSSRPYLIKPLIKENNRESCLMTTHLFQYLIKNKNKDKKRLGATSQLYLADGLSKIAEKARVKKNENIYFAGGITDNKIISEYFESCGFIGNKKIPRGDKGISFGQIIYYLLANSGN